MAQIPTAEAFLIRRGCTRTIISGASSDFFEDVQPKDLIEFAKLHVENFAKDFNLSCEYRQQLVETYIKKIV